MQPIAEPHDSIMTEPNEAPELENSEQKYSEEQSLSVGELWSTLKVWQKLLVSTLLGLIVLMIVGLLLLRLSPSSLVEVFNFNSAIQEILPFGPTKHQTKGMSRGLVIGAVVSGVVLALVVVAAVVIWGLWDSGVIKIPSFMDEYLPQLHLDGASVEASKTSADTTYVGDVEQDQTHEPDHEQTTLLPLYVRVIVAVLLPFVVPLVDRLSHSTVITVAAILATVVLQVFVSGWIGTFSITASMALIYGLDVFRSGSAFPYKGFMGIAPMVWMTGVAGGLMIFFDFTYFPLSWVPCAFLYFWYLNRHLAD